MKKILLVLMGFVLLPCTVFAQNIKANAINFGGDNILQYTSGNGAPTPNSCVGVAQYVQIDDTTGNPIWACQNHVFVHLTGGGISMPTPYQPTALVDDGTGNIKHLSESGIYLSASGDAMIAWREDRGLGIYDCRNPRYAGGCYGPTPGLALQTMENVMNCDMAVQGNGFVARTTLPPGVFTVGSNDAPTLILASGSIFEGTPGGEGSSTLLQAGYNNVNAVQVAAGRQTTCSDGAIHTNNAYHSVISYIAEHGCGEGQCVNVPGDGGDHPNGGPFQIGLVQQDLQGEIDHLYAANNGGSGIQQLGQDGRWSYFFTALNNEWYLFGHNVPGQVYDPTTDGQHGDVELESLDSQGRDIETYRALAQPGSEYGHLFGVLFGGGNSSVANLFLQVHEIDFGRIYGSGSNSRVSNFRFDFSGGDGLWNTDISAQFSNGLIDGSCLYQAVAISQGHCDQIFNAGLNGKFRDIQIADNPGLGQTYKTGDVYPFNTAQYLGMSQGTVFETPPSYFPGQGIDRDFANQTGFQSGGVPVTGPAPDVSQTQFVQPVDSSVASYTGFSNAIAGQVIHVRAGNSNVTFLGILNGGNFLNCTPGADLNLSATGELTYITVSDGGPYAPQHFQEYCDIPNEAYSLINFAGQPAPADLNGLGSLDVRGTGIMRHTADLSEPTLTANAPTTAFSYCIAVKVRAAGATYTSQQDCSNHPPPLSTNTNGYVFTIIEPIPQDWRYAEVYLTSTDTAIPGGLIYQVTAPGNTPGAAFTLSANYFADTGPIDGSAIGVLGLNTSGDMAFLRPPPATSTENCQDGEFYVGTAPAPVGAGVGLYRCHPDDQWTFYPLTATETSW